jgi:hypothetical protein
MTDKYLTRLERCLWLKTSRTVNHPVAEKVVDKLVTIVEAQDGYKAGNKRQERKAMRILVANFLSLIHQDHLSCLALSRDNGAYKRGHYNRSGVGSTAIFRVVNGLIKASLISQRDGYYFGHEDDGNGKCSRLDVRPELKEMLRTIPQAIVTVRDENFPLIHRKNKERELEDVPDSHLTRSMRRQIKAYNDLLDRHEITIGLEPKLVSWVCRNRNVDLTNNRYHRVFQKGSFKQGGRFYGPFWQNIPRELRAHILIDGGRTVELDYSGYHLNLCYGMEGEDRSELFGNEDPYALEGYDREPVKALLCIGLNEDDEARAIRAMRKDLINNDDYEYEKGFDFPALISAFKTKHPLIEKYIFSGMGSKVQYQDSVIMNNVIGVFVEKGIPALSIHDSVRVEAKYEKLAIEIMVNAYNDAGYPGTIGVDLKEFDKIDLETGDIIRN